MEEVVNWRDDSFVASYFQKYFDLGIFEGNKKKRFERFAGWQKKQIKNIANEYVKYVATKTEGCTDKFKQENMI